jgi:hypothetical protein
MNLTTASSGNDTLRLHPYLCTLQTCDLTLSSFDYRPTVVGNGLIAVIFLIFLIAQIFFGVKHKTWGYMTAMLLGLFLETVGYVARVLIHNSPFENNYFLIYLIMLTIAPAFLTAAYVSLSFSSPSLSE